MVDETDDMVESMEDVRGASRGSALPMLFFGRGAATSAGDAGGEPFLTSKEGIGADVLRIWRRVVSAFGVAKGLLFEISP